MLLVGVSPASSSVRIHQLTSGIAPLQQPRGSQFSAASPGTNIYWVGAYSYDSAALSNSGIRGTIQVIGTNVTGCLQFWVAEEMSSNNVWGQVGYFLCNTNGNTPTAFYQVWNSAGVAAGGSTSITTGLHQFSMYAQSGTTWAYAIDGSVFGTVVMNSTSSSSTYPIEALSEEDYLSNPYNPPQVELSSLQTLKSSNWYSPLNGYEPYGCGTSGMSCWGVAGNLQNSTIPVDAILVGGNTALVSAGTWLWQNGTPDFSMSASPTSNIATTGATTTSTITMTPVSSFSGTISLAYSTNSTSLVCTLSPTSVSGGSGTSTLSCIGATSGSYLATVTGTSGTLSHSVTVTFHVQDFTMNANPANVETGLGSQANSTITVTPLGGFGGTVTLTVTTNSTSISCGVSPTTIGSDSGTSTLTCSSNVPGDYLAIVMGTSGALSHNASIIYQITSLPGFTLSDNPTTFTFETGNTGTSTVTITALNGFTGTVTLAVMSNSTGLSCALSSSNIVGGSGTSSLHCTGSSGGSYIASVTGTSSGVASKTSTVTFHIQDFVMSASSASLRIDPGVTGSSSINFEPVEGFIGTITLSYSVSPTAGLTCSLNNGSIVIGPSQTVVLSCFGNAGAYNVTVTGTSGSLSRSCRLSYTIIPAKSGTTIQSYIYELVVGVEAMILVSVVALRKRGQRANR